MCTDPKAHLPVLFIVALALAACSSSPPDVKSASEPAAETQSAKDQPADKPIDLATVKVTAPKITPVKVSLEGKCDETFPLEKNEAGKIVQCNIKEDLPVPPLVCKQGYVPVLHKDQTFRLCNQKTEGTYGELRCKDAVAFHANGTMENCYLAKPIPGACKSEISFDENGKVTRCL